MDTSALYVLLSAVPDRRHHNIQHSLADVLLIALFSTVAGGSHFTDFEDFGELHLSWFRATFGIERVPSHDTFANVFRALDYRSFELALRTWTGHLLKDAVFEGPDVVSLDGKALNGAGQYTNIVSAWSSAHGVSLGGVGTEGAKQNELHAMVTLINQLRLKGAIVTADAAGTHTVVVDAVLAKGADYVLPVKANQGNTLETLEHCFKNPWERPQQVITLDKTGGRVEERTFELLALGKHKLPFTEKWSGFKAVARVTSQVSVKGKTTRVQRQYITSLTDVALFARAARAHWGVENALHWQLDVTFREDDCPVRDANAQKNLNTVRKLVLHTLKRLGTPGMSLARQRKRAGWSESAFEQTAALFLRG